MNGVRHPIYGPVEQIDIIHETKQKHKYLNDRNQFEYQGNFTTLKVNSKSIYRKILQ